MSRWGSAFWCVLGIIALLSIATGRPAAAQDGHGGRMALGTFNVGGAAEISVFASSGRRQDRCPDTPAGVIGDDAGCPTDGDRDGVFDGRDARPDTPDGAVGGAFGCPWDSDDDRAVDGIDIRPDTPPGARVDENGRPRDTDRDGVPDGIDRCAATLPGTQVDNLGYPVLFKEESGRVQPLILKGVTFAVGEATLTPESRAVLDDVAKSLLAHHEVRIEVSGHTDATGSRTLHMRLSLARAQSVSAYLARKGVAHSRLDAQGYEPNRTSEERSHSRRVQLHRIDSVR